MKKHEFPEWIWHPHDNGTISPGQSSLYFMHILDIDQKPDKCWLQIYSGTGYRFFVNGIQVGRDWYSGHGTYRHDLKPFLRQGSNLLAIEVYRGHVHPGLVAIGRIERPGESHEIMTHAGPQWLVSDTIPAQWPNPKNSGSTMYPSASLTDILNQSSDPELRRLGKEFSTFDPAAFEQEVCQYYGLGSVDDILVPGKRIAAVEDGGFFPVLQRLPDGRLAAVIRLGGPHVSIEGTLGITFSCDNGQSWSTPLTIAQGPADYRNPAFGVLQDGTLVVVFCICPTYDAQGNWTPGIFSGPLELMLTQSKDGGATWSSPEPLDCAHRFGLSPYGKMITLSDGTVLMSVYGKFSVHDNKKTRCGILRSVDCARTWHLHAIIAEGYNETALCLMPSGRLMAMLRAENSKANLWQCISVDGGKTWPEPTEITDALEHPADVLVLKTGELLLTYTSRHFPYGIQCKLSRDEGANWFRPHRFILAYDGITEDCGYPSSAMFDSDKIVTIYYSIGSRLEPAIGVHAMAVIYRIDDLASNTQ